MLTLTMLPKKGLESGEPAAPGTMVKWSGEVTKFTAYKWLFIPLIALSLYVFTISSFVEAGNRTVIQTLETLQPMSQFIFYLFPQMDDYIATLTEHGLGDKVPLILHAYGISWSAYIGLSAAWILEFWRGFWKAAFRAKKCWGPVRLRKLIILVGTTPVVMAVGILITYNMLSYDISHNGKVIFFNDSPKTITIFSVFTPFVFVNISLSNVLLIIAAVIRGIKT